MPATPDYAIIVPAYNEEAFLATTLVSLRAAMDAVLPLSGELIVTDNASTDATADIARAHGALVVTEPHRQIARSRNTGAKASRAPYLIFVDADTTIAPALLQQALAALATGKVVGGGAHVTFDAQQETLLVRSFSLLWHTLARTFKLACGAFVFCRRDAFEAVGGFDERYYASEEIHLSRALAKWGRKRRLKMVLLQEQIQTSARKLAWFGTGGMLREFLQYVFMPWRVRRRDTCAMWYVRPPAATAPKPPTGG